MKKILNILLLATTLMFYSCGASAQIFVEETQTAEIYYDYNYGTTIVYIESVPYYRYFVNNRYNYVVVPRERWCHITPYQPHITQHHPTHVVRHNPHFHGNANRPIIQPRGGYSPHIQRHQNYSNRQNHSGVRGHQGRR